MMYDVQYVLNNGGFGAPPTPNAYFNQHPVPGTGPYMFVALAQNSYMKFTQNPNYWGLSMTPDEISAQCDAGSGTCEERDCLYQD